MRPINLPCINVCYMAIFMQGLVSQDTVKDCASRLFMVRMRLGEFDPPEMNPYKKCVHASTA